MLDPWIIDQIRRREEDRSRREESPVVEMPEYPDPSYDRGGDSEDRPPVDSPGGERGVAIIDFSL